MRVHHHGEDGPRHAAVVSQHAGQKLLYCACHVGVSVSHGLESLTERMQKRENIRIPQAKGKRLLVVLLASAALENASLPHSSGEPDTRYHTVT